MHQTPQNMHQSQSSAVCPVPQLLVVGAYEAGCGRDFPPHHHEHWELVFYRRGHIEAPVGGVLHHTRPGLLLLTPPRTTHCEIATTGYANYYASFAAGARHPWPRELADDRYGTLAHLFGSLHRNWPAESAEDTLLLRALVMQLDIMLRRAARRASQTQTADELLVTAVERIWQEDFARPQPLAVTARQVGSSPSAIRAAFAAVRDQSPHEALYELRIRQALARIADGTHTLETIATQCGFASASHLSRRVKAATGRSAGAWRPEGRSPGTANAENSTNP